MLAVRSPPLPTRTPTARRATAQQSQPQLQISRPTDRAEVEAERAAGRATRTPLAPAPGPSGPSGGAPAASPALPPATVLAEIAALRGGGGAPLEPNLRAHYEARLGHDFGSVRVHTGPRAGWLADALDARAFIVGRDIVFGRREFAPSTPHGARLLAHELAHVAQGPAGPATIHRQTRSGADAAPKAPLARIPSPQSNLVEFVPIGGDQDLDMRKRSEYIDQQVEAVGVSLILAGYLLYIRGYSIQGMR